MDNKTVFITGAASGIGFNTVNYLSDRGYQVFAGVRNASDAYELNKAKSDSVRYIICDISCNNSCKAAYENVRQLLNNRRLSALVNCAGIAVAGPLMHLSIEQIRHQIEINLIGQMRVTQNFLPLLGTDKTMTGKPGRIVNISSVAGVSVTPLLTPYACSKFAMEALTKGLRIELMPYGIHVVAINPGPVQTSIWKKLDEDNIGRFNSTEYSESMKKFFNFIRLQEINSLPAEKVSKAIHKVLIAKNPKNNTFVLKSRLLFLILQIIPESVTEYLISRSLKLRKLN